VRDPFGDLYYPLFKGRDPCRTPMPWTAAGPHAGFSRAKPWLPLAPEHARQAADLQQADETSVLAFAKTLLRARKRHPAWLRGAIEANALSPAVLAFERDGEGERLIFVFNLSREPQTVSARAFAGWRPLDVPGLAKVRDGALVLPPLGYFAAAA
jgi:alpha-glucosidase